MVVRVLQLQQYVPVCLWWVGVSEMVSRLLCLHVTHLVQTEQQLLPSSDSMADRMFEGLVCMVQRWRSRCCSLLEMFQKVQDGLESKRSRLR